MSDSRPPARRLAALLTLAAAALLSAPGPVAATDGPLFSFHDRRITESSALVDLGPVMVTANDSGHPAQVFVVNPATGNTVGVTDFLTRTVDVEALARARGSAVWVGDIGDNSGVRKSVAVYHVVVGKGLSRRRPVQFRLGYPRGHPDAESLFADRSGRLYVITKSLAGGTVFAAPPRLSADRLNRLTAVGHVRDFATDAAMLPDGRHVVVRGYSRASVYDFPSWRRVGGWILPRQRQGEGISAGPGGRLRVSSEGPHSPVLQVSLPVVLVRRMYPAAATPAPTPSATPSAPPTASPTPTPTPSPTPSPTASGSASAVPSPTPPASSGTTKRQGPGAAPGFSRPWLVWTIPGVIGLGALGIGLGLRRRSE